MIDRSNSDRGRLVSWLGFQWRRCLSAVEARISGRRYVFESTAYAHLKEIVGVKVLSSERCASSRVRESSRAER
jgi:hypothetical protein